VLTLGTKFAPQIVGNPVCILVQANCIRASDSKSVLSFMSECLCLAHMTNSFIQSGFLSYEQVSQEFMVLMASGSELC